ncbi:MAG: HugZ family protein [Parvibaculaceae bacterium]
MTTPTGRSFTGEEARLLLRRARTASLGTSNREPKGPYVSLANLATDGPGHPVIFISRLAWHARNIEARPEGSVMVSEIPVEGDALTGARVTVMGRFERLETAEIAPRYAHHHPPARTYLDFPDFSFWRLKPEKIHAVAGFGRIETMEPAEVFLPESAAAAVMAGAEAAISHMNADHADAVALYAVKLLGATPGNWRVTAVDPDGAHLERDGKVLRLAFDKPVETAGGLRQAFVALAQKARNMM